MSFRNLQTVSWNVLSRIILLALLVSILPSPYLAPKIAKASISSVPLSAFPVTDGSIQTSAISADGATLYIGGSFGHVGGFVRNNIAAIDTATGNVTSWDPNADAAINVIYTTGTTVYVGGGFATIGGAGRNYIAALDTTTGLATAWDPNANNFVNSMALSGSTLYVGGVFSNIGGAARARIAAINTGTGTATAWNPGSDGNVQAMAISGSTLYVGGGFATIGGQTRNGIAALDTTVNTNNATSWDPNVDNKVFTLIVSGTNVYAGGRFITVNGGTTRNRIAAFDITTGLATAWDPNADAQVEAMALSGTTLYVGGTFTNIGGQARNDLAAVDTGTGLATTWDPNLDGAVSTIRLNTTTLFAGGSFLNVGGSPYMGFVAFDLGIPNPVSDTAMITASVPATLSFVIRNATDTANSNSCAFGTLNASATTTCAYRLKIQTNGAGGYLATLQADHDFGTGSATMTTVTDNTPVGAGNEAYGIESVQGATLGGRNVSTGAFDQPSVVSSIAGTTFDTSVSPVPTASAVLIDSYNGAFAVTSTPNLTATTLITHFATIANGTPAGNYGQTLTYNVTASY